jgi:hypothetical protein
MFIQIELLHIYDECGNTETSEPTREDKEGNVRRSAQY